MPSRVIVDTSFLVALNDPKDSKHRMSISHVATDTNHLMLPDVVLTEAAFLLGSASGIKGVLRFLERLIITDPTLLPIENADLPRIREIMGMYADARLDFVDCCLMALAERMNITTIYTFDRRDFTIFRPKHCYYLTLLP